MRDPGGGNGATYAGGFGFGGFGFGDPRRLRHATCPRRVVVRPGTPHETDGGPVPLDGRWSIG